MMYRTKDRDMVDLICHNYYGGEPHSVEAVYDRNPGLADHGPILPAGVVIDLPDAQPAEPQTIRLWD